MEKEQTAYRIIRKLHQSGHHAYLAGGCVRDRERGTEPKDYDIATSAKPEEIQKIFKKTIPVGVHFGVILVVENKVAFEVATFRTEGGYYDGRHPSEVNFTSLEEDAKRRDFTVNGLYYDLKSEKVIDLVGGKNDLKKKVIRTIGDPKTRFLEDHLRILRAVRFAVQLGFEIETETLREVKANAQLIEKVSRERVREEFSKLLMSSNPGKGIRLLDETGLLHSILPELEALKGVEQPIEYHPEGDVWIHTLMLMDGIKNGELELAMGALLHDIAKPVTFERASDRVRFHGHDRIGAEMAEKICKRLTFSNDQTDLICALVREHLRFKDASHMRVATLKRFIAIPRFDLHLELHRLDCMASHRNLDAYEFCKEKKGAFEKLPKPVKNLVDGGDLIELGYEPGPLFAKILRAVEDGVLEGTLKTRKSALSFIKKQFPLGKERD